MGYRPSTLRRVHGGWFRFVTGEGDLSEDEAGALGAAGDWLDELESSTLPDPSGLLVLDACSRPMRCSRDSRWKNSRSVARKLSHARPSPGRRCRDPWILLPGPEGVAGSPWRASASYLVDSPRPVSSSTSSPP
jgi:hypothetical protein